ncbi:MAG: ATP-binding protein [Phycisphaerae bacterium]
MRLGIRAKLVGTLLLAGLLPLVLTIGVVLIGVAGLRVQSKGRTYNALAEQQARHLAWVLKSQIELGDAVNGLPGSVDALERANTVPPLAQEQIDKIEAGWPGLDANSEKGLLGGILKSPLSAQWRSVRAREPRFSEVLITDLSGRLVAATNKTSDYFQADEDWWKACYADGKGRAIVTGIATDESATSPEGKRGTLVAGLCLPIYDKPEKAGGAPRKLIGIAKLSVDASWVLRQIETTGHVAELPRAAWLVNENGESLLGDVTSAPAKRLPARSLGALSAGGEGWVMDDDLPGYEVIAFAAVDQAHLVAEGGRRWYVVVATDKASVLGPVYRMTWLIAAMGLAMIVVSFAAGLIIARREIIRPVLALRDAVDRIKAGHRGYRLSERRGGRQVFRDDEIGQLARDFNLMASHLERQIKRIEEADAVKRQFIDLASHELRTPVTYILGAAQLAQRQDGHADPKLAERISSKAQRLNRIIENMFKLLAADRFEKQQGVVPEDVDLRAMIDLVCREHEPFLKERRQSYHVGVADDASRVRADGDKVRDILSNLISNAIRFSPDGGVVGVRTARVTTHRGEAVEVAVSDTGPGIPPDDVPHLFQPFFTGADVNRHSSGDYQYMSRGMGLGLSVVKRFVELQDGGVLVDTSSRGTTVRVRLPLGTADKSTVAAGSSNVADSGNGSAGGL